MKINYFTGAVFLTFFSAFSFAQTQTLTIQPGAAEGKDALIRDQTPTLNIGSHPNYEAEAWTSGGAFVSRGLIAFDLSALPAGAQILSAKLSLYGAPQQDGDTHSSLSGSNTCVLSRITGDWTETGVTWANQPQTSAFNVAVLAESSTDFQDYLEINVMQMLLDAIDAGSDELGIMISLVEEQHYRRLVFASSDYSNAAKHPKLEIVYKGSLGLSQLSTDFVVYPNPCTDVLKIEGPEGELLVFDMSGAEVLHSESSSQVDVSALKPGTYILKIVRDGNFECIRFVKE